MGEMDVARRGSDVDSVATVEPTDHCSGNPCQYILSVLGDDVLAGFS